MGLIAYFIFLLITPAKAETYVERVNVVRQLVHGVVVDAGVPLPTMTTPWKTVRFDPILGSVYTRKVGMPLQWQDSSNQVYIGSVRILTLSE